MYIYQYVQTHIIILYQHVMVTSVTIIRVSHMFVTQMIETCLWRIIMCVWTYLQMYICWLSYKYKIFFKSTDMQHIKFLLQCS